MLSPIMNQKAFETELKTVYGNSLEKRVAKDGMIEYIWNGVVVGVWGKNLNHVVYANELEIPDMDDMAA